MTISFPLTRFFIRQVVCLKFSAKKASFILFSNQTRYVFVLSWKKYLQYSENDVPMVHFVIYIYIYIHIYIYIYIYIFLHLILGSLFLVILYRNSVSITVISFTRSQRRISQDRDKCFNAEDKLFVSSRQLTSVQFIFNLLRKR